MRGSCMLVNYNLNILSVGELVYIIGKKGLEGVVGYNSLFLFSKHSNVAVRSRCRSKRLLYLSWLFMLFFQR